MKNAKISSGPKRRFGKRGYYNKYAALIKSNSPVMVAYVKNEDIPRIAENGALNLMGKSRRIGKKSDKTRKQIGKISNVSVTKRNNKSWQFNKKWNSRKCKKTN